MSTAKGRNRHPPAVSPPSNPQPVDTRSPKLPDDLRLIPLKFSGDCNACGTELEAGARAHWSFSARAVWRQGCVQALSIPMEPDSVTDDPQERWARLCRYLSKSVLAEMADTLVRLRATDKWFLHDTESEGLITGALDCAAIPERLGECFDKAGGHSACIFCLWTCAWKSRSWPTYKPQ